MGNLFKSLKDYFENTPKDVLENDWKEIEPFNEIEPTINDFLKHNNKINKLSSYE